MTKSPESWPQDSWQALFMGQVDAKLSKRSASKRPYRDFKARIPLNAAPALHEAARARGMSVGAFVRRSALAFVAHDLGIELSELLEHEPVTRVWLEAVAVTHDMAGQGHGQWVIKELA